MTQPSEEILEVLGDLERAEARLLVWGVVDAAMSEEEVLQRIEESSARHALGDPAAAILDELLDRNLLFEAEDLEGEWFRTRMAEAVRLFARLRQWRHGHPWTDAPSLVSDFRFDLRPRSYPKRSHQPADVVDALRPLLNPPRRAAAVDSLLRDSGAFRERKLAAFQIEAADRILRGLSSQREGGTIVTAGTGSGKTLAAYLPALVWLADEIDQTHATRVIAIYPRNELLKDQIVQCLGELQRMAGVPMRPIRIGALFGPTPGKIEWIEGGFAPWPVHGSGGRRCPYVQCPRCRAPLIWTDADRAAGDERLRCTTCAFATESDQFAMTRDSIRARPPDILFTTTEMLNRLSSNVSFGHVLGSRGTKRPRLMLLDEVHTYGGPAGAQVAHLLRRWHHAVGGRVQFVGLSATLRGAGGFFANLTGLRDGVVREVTPAPDALEQRGMEYMLALRGNPMSSTALLSTTIQSLMLGARMLDPTSTNHGVGGSRVFAFTDKLDLANRLFHFYSDAEGWGAYDRPLARPSLAALRAPAQVTRDRRLARLAGQVWDAPEEIGHQLATARKRVGITTSQRGGVQDRDVIIATASLEVGYNDEEVGLVLQHKAPRDPAAFIQRRGRAGRVLHQRPWTVIVLSDFGRDRLAYQSYEQLFDPSLPARSLPLANQSVRRMQAAFSTLDWLASKRSRGYSVWDDLTKPTGSPEQRALEEIIERALRDPALQNDLAQHVGRALAIELSEAVELLWSPPRSVLLEFLPTALRRLKSQWFNGVKGAGEDLRASNSPLPDFMPANLFTDLQLPEVTVIVPPQNRNEDPGHHELPVFLALSEFAPGNVSFRYAIQGRWAASWVAPDSAGALDVTAFCVRYDDLGRVTDASGTLRLLRPWELQTAPRPGNVLDSSRGSLRWSGGPQLLESGKHLDLPDDSPWANVLLRAETHLHATHQPLKIQRYAIGYGADVGYQSGTYQQFHGDFTVGDDRVGLGFEYDADAVAFHVDLPEHAVLPGSGEEARERSFRAAWFSELIGRDSALAALTSVFQREQLERAYLAALADEALAADVDLSTARHTIGNGIHDRLVHAVEALFSTIDAVAAPARGLDELRSLARSGAVVGALDRIASSLWAPFGADAYQWAEERLAATLAGALSDAVQAMCPDFDVESEAAVDIVQGPTRKHAVWFVETSPGGGGIIEALQSRLLSRPRHFIALLDRAVRPSDFEVVDASLRQVLEAAVKPSPLAESFARYRASATNDDRVHCLRAIRRELARLDVPAHHPVIAALAARVLRFGSAAETDAAIRDLARAWDAAEERVAVELESSVFAFTQRRLSRYDALLASTPGGDIERRRIAAIFATLWPRGWRARAEGLRAYSPYRGFPPSDRLALERFRAIVAPAVDGSEPDWRRHVDEHLRLRGMAVVEVADKERLASLIRQLTVEPTDTGLLLLHPVVVGVDGAGDRVRATLVVDEGFVP